MSYHLHMCLRDRVGARDYLGLKLPSKSRRRWGTIRPGMRGFQAMSLIPRIKFGGVLGAFLSKFYESESNSCGLLAMIIACRSLNFLNTVVPANDSHGPYRLSDDGSPVVRKCFHDYSQLRYISESVRLHPQLGYLGQRKNVRADCRRSKLSRTW